FFFSSRRRHTRSYGDWSSDVCSSDLERHGEPLLAVARIIIRGPQTKNRIDKLMPNKSSGDTQEGCQAQRQKFELEREHWPVGIRSEERRVGKECRSRRWRYNEKERER